MDDAATHARDFAIAAHGAQRYGDQPYVFHLDMVAGFLAPYGEQAQIIGYLHDVAEDTSVPLDEVRREFGELVASCVALVTDAPGATRPERKALTNAKLAKVTGDEQLALIVKAADRLANLTMSARGGTGSKLDMYRSEHREFRNAAHRPGLCEDLWRQIDAILAAGIEQQTSSPSPVSPQ